MGTEFLILIGLIAAWIVFRFLLGILELRQRRQERQRLKAIDERIDRIEQRLASLIAKLDQA